MQTLRKGSKGEDVKVLLKLLHLFVDGIFGSITEEAVKLFQREHNLLPDGIVGDNTWKELNKLKDGIVSEANLLDGIRIKKSKRYINRIVIHCTATEEGKDYTVDWIRKIHKSKGYSDIGYHYVIYRDGSLHLGRDVDIVGAHARNYNANSIGIVYVGGCPKGDTKKNKDTRTPQQKDTIIKLLKKLRILYPKALIVGHKDLNATGCPSFNAKAEYINI